MAVYELILLLCEIARDKWCSYWEHDPVRLGPEWVASNKANICAPSLTCDDYDLLIRWAATYVTPVWMTAETYNSYFNPFPAPVIA